MILVYQSLALLLGVLLELTIGSSGRSFSLSAGIDHLIRLSEALLYPEFPGQRALIRRGRLAAAVVPAFALVVSALLLFFLYRSLPAAGLILEAVLFWQTLHLRQAWQSVSLIAADLAGDDLYAARLHLSYLTAESTSQMEPADITEHALRIAHEDTVNGMAGPLFYFFYLGAPGAIFYLTVLRMHKITGVPADRYRFFGIASGRLHEIVGIIPNYLVLALRSISNQLLPKTKLSRSHAEALTRRVADSRLSLLLAIALGLLLKVPAILILIDLI